MGQQVNPSVGSSSGSSGISKGIFSLKAGASIANNDVLELGPDGKCYPAQCTDYAAIANCNYGTAQTNAATGQIVAQTQVTNGQLYSTVMRYPLLTDSDGNVYAVTANAGFGSTGLMLAKYSPLGALLGQVTIDTNSNVKNPKAFFLSSGDIAVVGDFGQSGNGFKFAIYDKNLGVVCAPTNIAENPYNGSVTDAIPLSGGGFAIVYQPNASQLTTRMVVYGNTGAVVTAPVTIFTRTGTTASAYHAIAQQSDGNIAVACHSSNSTGSQGLFYGVVTTAGASVSAFANLNVSTSWNEQPAVVAMAGYVCVAKNIAAAMTAYVFNNAGVQQGGTFSSATTVTDFGKMKLMAGGGAFWLIWPRNTDSKEVLTKLPTTGTNFSTTDISTTTTQYAFRIDAFYENGFIVGVSQPGAGAIAPTMWVVSTTTMSLISKSGTTFGAAPATTSGYWMTAIPGGDFSFICLYDYASSAATNFCVGKYANTAIMGVAQSASAADGLVNVGGIAGAYAANPLKGSPSKAFDHSATNIYGNKGSLMNYGTVLKGF